MYGITPPPERQLADHDSQKIIAVLENQVADLQKQLELSNERETALIDEKSKRLYLLSAEKEEKRARMPQQKKKRNLLTGSSGASARDTVSVDPMEILSARPLDFSTVFCYTISKLVDRIITATHALRCALSSPVIRCERVSNERYLVSHIEDLSVS